MLFRNFRQRKTKALALGLAYVAFSVFNGPAAGSDLDLNKLASKTRIVAGIGIGGGFTEVRESDTRQFDTRFINEKGVSLSFRLASEYALNDYIALQAGVDVFSSAGFASLFSAEASVAGSLTAGTIIGKVSQPGQPYLSLSYGWGAASLSDQAPDTGCIVCSGERGGSAAGASSRIALGLGRQSNSRLELVWIRAGGNGLDTDFGEGTDAYLNAVLLVISGSN